MKSHKDALVHRAPGEWTRGTQHRTNQFSQLKIQASGLNYACYRIVDSLMERNTIQKKDYHLERVSFFMQALWLGQISPPQVICLFIKVDQICNTKQPVKDNVDINPCI